VIFEQFMSKINGFRNSPLHKAAASEIEDLAKAHYGTHGAEFLDVAWGILDKRAMLASEKPQFFALKEVRQAFARALRQMDSERSSDMVDCEKCRGFGMFLVYGSHGVRPTTEGCYAHAFFPWKVITDPWNPDWPVSSRMYHCPCGRMSDRAGMLRADGDVVLLQRRYYRAWLTSTPKVGEPYENVAQADNCCTRLLLIEAGQVECRQFARATLHAGRAGYPTNDELRRGG